MDNRHYQAFANATTPPELSSLASEGYASSGSASENQLPTVPGAAWFHSVASELHNAILALGVTPDHLRIDQLASGLRALLPAGTVILSAGDRVPSGYLLCNGAAVSRTDYARLFEAIGTIYGAGDGETTFNLPDLRDRFIEGAGSNALGTYLEAGLPNITGRLSYSYTSFPITDQQNGFGALRQSFPAAEGFYVDRILGGRNADIYFDASLSNSTYGNASTVQPPLLCLNALIKY